MTPVKIDHDVLVRRARLIAHVPATCDELQLASLYQALNEPLSLSVDSPVPVRKIASLVVSELAVGVLAQRVDYGSEQPVEVVLHQGGLLVREIGIDEVDKV